MRSFLFMSSTIPKNAFSEALGQLMGRGVHLMEEKGQIKISVEGEGTRDSVCNERAIRAFALSRVPEGKVSVSILNANDEVIGFLGEAVKQ